MTLNIKEDERIALFIDGANFYAAARALGFDIDYKRLLELFRERGRLVRALYYTALVEDQEYSPIRPLVDWLDYNGFTMVTKPTKEFTDSLGRRKIKGDMDIELAIDMLEMAPHLDHVILFSGDGDFRLGDGDFLHDEAVGLVVHLPLAEGEGLLLLEQGQIAEDGGAVSRHVLDIREEDDVKRVVGEILAELRSAGLVEL